MEYTLREELSPQERAAIASGILAALPEWFGIPESTAKYVEGCKSLPFVAVCDGEAPVGFLALRQTAPQAGEVYVMGTLPAYHRKGVGRALLAWAEQYARAAGWKLLQVKTWTPPTPARSMPAPGPFTTLWALWIWSASPPCGMRATPAWCW